MTYAAKTKVDQDKIDYGFLVLTHIACADQQINSEKLKYLEELGNQRNISERTKDEMKRILADNNQHLQVNYITNSKLSEQRSLVMKQILDTFYNNDLFRLSEQEAIMRIASVCNWSQKGVKRIIQKEGFKFQTNNNGGSEPISPEIEKNLVKELTLISELNPPASEKIVSDNFIATSFLNALGFNLQERVPDFKTGQGADAVDYALRKNTKDNIFLHAQVNPHILVELKKRNIDLAYNRPNYKTTFKQLKRYLLAPNSTSVQWGIITNSKHIQLFRKHGKVIHPATTCLEINPDNIVDVTRKN